MDSPDSLLDLRRLALMGVLVVLANALGGCALYDAFTNDPEGEDNNGNDEPECATGFTVDGRADQCLLECKRATEFSDALDRSLINSCADGDVCVSLFENQQGAEPIGRLGGVCITREEREACAQLSFQDYEEADAQFEPCSEESAQYHVSARPGGGFVLAGCRVRAMETSDEARLGIRVLWLDEFGRFDTRKTEARTFIPLSKIIAASPDELDPEVQPTVYALEAIDEESALVVVRTKRTDDQVHSSTVGITRQGAVDLGQDVFWTGQVEPCVAGADNVEIESGSHLAYAGGWFIVGSCFEREDMSRLGLFVGRVVQLETEPQIQDVRPSQLSFADGVIQDLSVPRGASGLDPGSSTARVLLFDVDNERLNSKPLVRNPAGGDDYKLGTDSGQVTDPETVFAPADVGYKPLPTASQYIDTSNKVWMAAQDSSPARPWVFSPNPEINDSILGEPGSMEGEQSLGLVRVGRSYDTLKTQPTPGDGSTTWALLTVVGSGDEAFGRLYGLDSELEPVWTVELGKDTEFMPQQIASSRQDDSGRIAVVGRNPDGQMRVFFADALGRGFCDLELLSEHHQQP